MLAFSVVVAIIQLQTKRSEKMKKLPKVKHVKAAAEQACFYVDENGDYFRINYCLGSTFCVTDEDSGIEFTMYYKDARKGHFEKLVPITY